MNRIFLGLLVAFVMTICGCTNNKQQAESIVKADNVESSLADTIKEHQFRHWNKSVEMLELYRDTLEMAQRSDDLDLALAMLTKMDMEYNRLVNDIQEFVYYKAYGGGSDSVWMWLYDNHKEELDKFLYWRKEIYADK